MNSLKNTGLFLLGLALVFSHQASAFTIANVHKLSESPGRVYRGSQPLTKVTEIAEAGITDVLIFKNDNKGEVAAEIAALSQLGYGDSKINHFPMEWKDIQDLTAACKLTVKALLTVQKISNTEGRSIYFHCTAGEDRTGMLAGLYRMSMQNWTAKRAYKDEMCKYGFADGNPQKPALVANQVRKNLLPIYAVLSSAIEAGSKITPSLCDSLDSEKALVAFPKCSQ